MLATLERSWLPDFKACEQDDYKRLLSQNRFYYRIFDDTFRGSLFESKTGFIAHRYAYRTKAQLENLEDNPFDDLNGVHDHLTWNKIWSSPWISTTSDWAWAVWELYQRIHYRKKSRYPRLAVIDSHLLLKEDAFKKGERNHGFFFYALQLLKTIEQDDRTYEEHYDLANASAEVLFHAWIPSYAIVSVLTLDDIIPKLPRYAPRSLPESALRSTMPGFRLFRVDSHICFKEILDSSNEWTRDHGQACGALACRFLWGAIGQVSDFVRRLIPRDSGDKSSASAEAATQGNEISCKGAEGSVGPTEDIDNLIILMERLFLSDDVLVDTTQVGIASKQPSGTNETRLPTRAVTVVSPLNELASMQFMVSKKTEIQVLVDSINGMLSITETIDQGKLRTSNEAESSPLKQQCEVQVQFALKALARTVEPGWVPHARAAIERLREAILHLASTIAHWLVESFSVDEWAEIKDEIYRVASERLQSLEAMVRPYEIKGVVVAGPITKEMVHFENGENPRAEMQQ